MAVECPTCGDGFGTERGVKVHHAKTHGESIAGELFECDNCGGAARRTPALVGRYEHDFCSPSCHHEFRDERATVECNHCGSGKVVHRYELERSETFYCDMDCYFQWQAEHYNGPGHHNWRGGKSMYDAVKKALGSASWKTYRKRARERGDGVCEMCGGDNGDQGLHVHHTVPVLAGGSNHPNNLMLLCQPCHNTVESHARRLFEPVLTE